jgi:hypothetical protein
VLGVDLQLEKQHCVSMTVDHDQVIDFTTYHQFVIDSFHDNLLGRVLADVESELENFVVAILLDERRVYV